MPKDLAHQLHPPKMPCDCSPPAVLVDLLPASSSAGSRSDSSDLARAFAAHCAHATGFEGRACGGLEKKTGQ
jgi:hypothetical protein